MIQSSKSKKLNKDNKIHLKKRKENQKSFFLQQLSRKKNLKKNLRKKLNALKKFPLKKVRSALKEYVFLGEIKMDLI